MIKKIKGAAVAVIPASMLLAGQAHAALAEEVTTALETAKTDSMALGAMVLGVLIGIYGLKLLRKAL